MPIACLLVGAVFFAAFVAHQVFWKKGKHAPLLWHRFATCMTHYSA